ncbi:hypothetical protein ORJ66_08475 [Pseudoalteromonas tunicata]|uniref:hypothetical protein n=1 Tax=Pseudoalteromonas tunicata TaxID=314281 RepID=UPI00273D4E69|nr:hypothetical protein [Pseudoalteromonas tunicata]MDP5213075.1 hypothetical protein [Pseudoalteromonas tunicata]
MEGLIFLVIVIFIFIAIVSGVSDSVKKDDNVKVVTEFMNEMREKNFGVEVNIKGDLNGTLVLGDLVVENSFDTIQSNSKTLGAAISEMGTKIKRETLNSEKIDSIYNNFKTLVAVVSADKRDMAKSAWLSFLDSYPTIEKELAIFLIIEESVRRVHMGLKGDPFGSGTYDGGSDFTGASDSGSDSGFDSGGGCSGGGH